MPPIRLRRIQLQVSKAAKFWPAICLIGPRQVGKSTLLRSLKDFEYVTLDKIEAVELANKNPNAVLSPPCIIDEAQKAPPIFDAIKVDIDQNRRPGKYILTGSVRFSKRTLIRESLTGRAKTVTMFPLTCAETLEIVGLQSPWEKAFDKPRVERKEFLRYLKNGGMPGTFAVRKESEMASYWNAMIESYVFRDLLIAVSKNPRPQLALGILNAIAEILAMGELPTFSRILKKTGGTRSVFEKHLIGLEDLMIIHRISNRYGTAALDIFLPFDSAFFLSLLKVSNPLHDVAIHLACIYITLVNEALADASFCDRSEKLEYAESPKGELVHLITQTGNRPPVFRKISEEPVPHDYHLRFLSALATRENGNAICLTSCEKGFQEGAIRVMPWECVL